MHDIIIHGTSVQHLYHCTVVLHYLKFEGGNYHLSIYLHILVFIKIVMHNILKQEAKPTHHPVAGADGQQVHNCVDGLYKLYE